jgi:hypothetical protein
MPLYTTLIELTNTLNTLNHEILLLEAAEVDRYSDRCKDLHDIGIKIQAIKTRLYEIDNLFYGLGLQ